MCVLPVNILKHIKKSLYVQSKIEMGNNIPAPVCPYAIKMLLRPVMEASTRGLPTTWYTCSKTREHLYLTVLLALKSLHVFVLLYIVQPLTGHKTD